MAGEPSIEATKAEFETGSGMTSMPNSMVDLDAAPSHHDLVATEEESVAGEW